MTRYMNIAVSSRDIAAEIARDDDFAYDVLSEVAYYMREADYPEFVTALINSSVEEANPSLLHLLAEIHKQYEALK